MSANRILYVSYNPQNLVRDERLLIRAGYEVDSVFGIDGLIAFGSVRDYASVLIDHECPAEARPIVISWLKAQFPEVSILPVEWAHEYAVDVTSTGSSSANGLSQKHVQESRTESQVDHTAASIAEGVHERLEDVSQKKS